MKIFNYLQNNGASNYYYKSLGNEITELRNNGVIYKTFRIINPIEEMLNFQEDDVDITSENSDVSFLNTQSSKVDEENGAAPSLNNNTRLLILKQFFQVTLKFYFSLLKINSMVKYQPYLLDELYDLKNELKILRDNYLTPEYPDSNEKEKISGLNQKVRLIYETCS